MKPLAIVLVAMTVFIARPMGQAQSVPSYVVAAFRGGPREVRMKPDTTCKESDSVGNRLGGIDSQPARATHEEQRAGQIQRRVRIHKTFGH